jgi:phosphoglycolate phosphatase
LSLLLFDIDGTLLLSGGAGMRAMTRAFHETFGVPNAFDGMPPAGRTDTFLLAGAFARAEVEDSPAHHARFRDAYVPILVDEIAKRGHGRYGVMPGIEALLTSLRSQGGWHLALLTGNYEGAARIKLRHFGLDGYFDWGVFGEESGDRRVLGRIALERAREREIPETSCSAAIVIGDTPDDIACAHAVGARSLAVATGSFTVDELTAAGAHVALVDLSDTESVLRTLGARMAEAPGSRTQPAP